MNAYIQQLHNLVEFWGGGGNYLPLLSLEIVADGSIHWWQIIRISNVYIIIRSLKIRAD